MKEITLQLTVEETNTILESLGNQPFSKVFTLIANIQEQASGQLDAGSPTIAEDVDPPSVN